MAPNLFHILLSKEGMPREEYHQKHDVRHYGSLYEGDFKVSERNSLEEDIEGVQAVPREEVGKKSKSKKEEPQHFFL